MAETTIEWTSQTRADGSIVPGYTFNPWRGCDKVSPGCKFCYAETLSKRNPKTLGEWGADGVRAIAVEGYWQLPFRWNREAAEMGEKRRVFSLSLGDWLEHRPELIRPRLRLLDTIRRTPNLIWLLLTKRPADWQEVMYLTGRSGTGDDDQFDDTLMWMADWMAGAPPENVWPGVSVENQEWADKRREPFEYLPGARRFVSYEPALGPVDWRGWEFADWFISGGESGKDKNIRPPHPDWFRATRDWCRANSKAYFHKQWGEWRPATEGESAITLAQFEDLAEGRIVSNGRPLYVWPTPDPNAPDIVMARVGKASAGRELDGRIWNQSPSTPSGDPL